MDEAIASFQRAVEIHPKYGEAHYGLAVCYFEKGEFKLAILHAEEAGKLGIIVDPKLLERLKPYH